MGRKRRPQHSDVTRAPHSNPEPVLTAAEPASPSTPLYPTSPTRQPYRSSDEGLLLQRSTHPRPQPSPLPRNVLPPPTSTDGTPLPRREEPSVVASDECMLPLPRLRHVPNSGEVFNVSGADLSVLPHSTPMPHLGTTRTANSGGGSDGGVVVTSAQNAAYARHWSEVVLGATSAIMFVLVLCISYFVYVLVTPYGQSIMNGVLLSIVMHPQSRLRSVLYMGTAVDRMSRVQRHWAVRGRLTGMIGSWLSLRHFFSFVVMQGTFFLGLNKIRVHAKSSLLGDDGADGYAAVAAAPPATAKGDAQRKQGRSKATGTAAEHRPAASAKRRTTSTTKTATATRSAVAAPAASPTAQHRRLVATPRGRRVLRYLTIFVLVTVAHLLIGVVYFVLLHLALAIVFAVTVPFMPANSFVRSMGRLWRVAVVTFFLVGLALNATADVLSIGAAVRRTTSAVVGTSTSTSSSNSGAEESELPSLSMPNVSSNSSSSGTAGSAALPTDGLMDALGFTGPQNSRLDVVLVGKVQDLMVQELADMFSDGNVTLMLETLNQVLPPQLLAIVTRDAVGGPSSSSTKAQPFSWRTTWANARSLRSASAAKSLIYASLSGPAARVGNDTNSSADLEHSTGAAAAAAAAGAKMDIDWLTVSRLIAARVLPYVELGLRICMRVGSNLLGLFDSLYAVMLFVFFFRYLTHLEHTVLYYGVAKVLRVMQPELGDYHARNIEHDITVSFITLLQSFWHLTWFHFCVTFCVFKMWGFPTPFLQGLVSVVLALFPLVPKWLSPCSIALVYMLVQLAGLLTSDVPGTHLGDTTATAPLLDMPAEGHAWMEVRVWGKPYPLHYTRALSLALAVLLECGDEWLLCVSRGLRGGFVTAAAEKGREQLQPFVVGTSLVLGFVAYGMRGIVFGPLTVIVARVLFDNWDAVLESRDLTSSFVGRPLPSSPPRYFLDEADEEDANSILESSEPSRG